MSDVQGYVKRLLNTLWQSFLSSLAVAQLIRAVSNGQLTLVGTLLLAAMGAAVGAAITFLKNVAFQPTGTGVSGIVERVVSTFVEGAGAAIPMELVAGLFTHYTSDGLRSVGLAALGGGIAAILSLVQHIAQGVPSATETALQPFVFVGPDGTDVAARDIQQFIQLAALVSDPTWEHHIASNDFSKWVEFSLKDPSLAAAVRGVESSGGNQAQSRAEIVDLIRGRYRLWA